MTEDRIQELVEAERERLDRALAATGRAWKDHYSPANLLRRVANAKQEVISMLGGWRKHVKVSSDHAKEIFNEQRDLLNSELSALTLKSPISLEFVPEGASWLTFLSASFNGLCPCASCDPTAQYAHYGVNSVCRIPGFKPATPKPGMKTSKALLGFLNAWMKSANKAGETLVVEMLQHDIPLIEKFFAEVHGHIAKATAEGFVVTFSASPASFAKLGHFSCDSGSCYHFGSERQNAPATLLANPNTVVILVTKAQDKQENEEADSAGAIKGKVIGRAWGGLLENGFFYSNVYGAKKEMVDELISKAFEQLYPESAGKELTSQFFSSNEVYCNGDGVGWGMEGQRFNLDWNPSGLELVEYETSEYTCLACGDGVADGEVYYCDPCDGNYHGGCYYSDTPHCRHTRFQRENNCCASCMNSCECGDTICPDCAECNRCQEDRELREAEEEAEREAEEEAERLCVEAEQQRQEEAEQEELWRDMTPEEVIASNFGEINNL